MNRLQLAEQFRKALQLFANSLDEETAMEVATVYDAWEEGKAYKTGEYLTYGVNGVDDPQLYKVVQDHTSQADWSPVETPSLYTPIGLDAEGFPVWSQPTGAHDAYALGAKVSHNEKHWISEYQDNVWEPGVYGWTEVNTDG